MSTPPSVQQSPQSKRKKRPVEDVSFEDLLAAHRTEREPGQLPREGVVLIGVDVELQRRMAERATFPAPLNDTNIGAPEIAAPKESSPLAEGPAVPSHSNFGAPIQRADELDAPRIGASSIETPAVEASPVMEYGAPNFAAPEFDIPESAAPNNGAPMYGAPNFDLTYLLKRPHAPRSYAIHPISRVEDVFTPAEREILRWLWEKGTPVPATGRIRLVTGPNGEGARRLAIQAGLIYNTFKNLTRSLSTKLAVDIVKPEKNQPAVYVVYQADAILRRQREAGFTGVLHKNGGGRELVSGASEPAPRRPDLTLSELEQCLVQCTKL